MHFMKHTALLAVLSTYALFITGCTKPTDPDDPGTTNKNTIVVAPIAGLPSVGGNVTGVDIADDGSMVAIIDGKLYTLSGPGADPVEISSNNNHTKVAIGKSGEIYTVTDTELRTYTSGGAGVVVVPIDPAGPLATNRRVEKAKFLIAPSGTAFVSLVNNTPQTYVYYSTDKGQTWKWMQFKTAEGTNIPLMSTADIAAASNGDLYVGCASVVSGLYKSTDMGATWTKLSGSMPNGETQMFINSAGYLYTWIPKGGELRVSLDGGKTFDALTPHNAYPFITHLVEGSGGALYAAEGTGILRSIDGGRTWKQCLYAQANDLAANGAMMAVGNAGDANGGGGITAASNSALRWSSSGVRPIETVTSMALDKDGALMCVANRTLFRQSGSTWQSWGTGNLQYLAATPQGQILTGAVGALSYSGDNGATWTLSSTLPGYIFTGQGSIVLPVVLGKRNGDFIISVATYRNDLSQHTNGALYKVGASGIPELIPGTPGPITRMLEDANGILFASTEMVDPFTMQFSSESYKSTDGGMTWTKTADVGIKALAVNSQGTAFSSGGETHFTLGTLGTETPRSVTLEGFTSLPQLIQKAMFDKSDKLYLQTIDKGIFVSAGPVR